LAGGQNATAALVARAASLPDMTLGPVKALVTIVEYVSMSYPHCAAFEDNFFRSFGRNVSTPATCISYFRNSRSTPRLRVFRCWHVASPGRREIFDTIDTLFKQQDALMAQTKEILMLIGKTSRDERTGDRGLRKGSGDAR
jgi:protein-disulfide isomerase